MKSVTLLLGLAILIASVVAAAAQRTASFRCGEHRVFLEFTRYGDSAHVEINSLTVGKRYVRAPAFVWDIKKRKATLDGKPCVDWHQDQDPP
jgi:hypothetical protein